ncbi:C4-dicarboxylate ABC transporter [Thioalkalivibrio denitrificans]|uniref:C4-dicarboxylate ABC transporter n=1 Tax=Thioalkalivibrio denitrificans TaxID=108003 RepID=A0A1V3NJB2_9GAMM|nr:TRAP transporter permease [Thioalkalivibrio denitrificans]OOG25199.1 C4-dicarboxylate ABC transporter [Thioalkalivibrio denitrificans]
MTAPDQTPAPRAGASAAPEAAQLVVSMEAGARDPGALTRALIYATALAWSLFQVWIASPFGYWLGFLVIPETQARAIHLAFAVFLAFLAFPGWSPLARRHRPVAGVFFVIFGLGVLGLAAYNHLSELPRAGVFAIIGAVIVAMSWPNLRPAPLTRVPAMDWGLAILAAFCAAYLFIYHQELARRPGSPTPLDLVVAGCGMALLLEATRRVLGPALMIIAGAFLFYTFAGPWMPDLLAHRGASFGRAMSQQWLSNEGVFGIALGVSTSFVFLFVLFGALLERAGAGGYFIRVAFALLGHLRGGPAKAAVVASGLTGVVSGSSIANTVTTGTFTIPLMRKVGLSAPKAGAVEVASSVNGQLMPPVMGAAAFLMVEYVGIPYVEVIRHAFLPAVIAYIALLYIVHLEALKMGLEGLPRLREVTLVRRLVSFGLTVSGLLILAGVVYYGLGWIKTVAGDDAIWIIGVLVLGAYLGLMFIASRVDEVHMVDEDHLVLPDPGPTIRSGLHYLLPVIVLIWCLVVERLSPGLSAFWAVMFMCFILLTQRPIMAMLRGTHGYASALRRGVVELADGMVQGARNMVGIGVATAAAGIIVGTVAMTGIGLVMTDLVELLSGGNILLMLLLTALICLILGLGLPTTANYIIVATLMAPVIVDLGAQHNLLIPLIAAHLFVFYFGIMADVTPPVGLASFAAAAVARADPISTGVQAFWYSLRTVALPFFFVFNTQLLLIGITSVWQLLLTFFGALAGMLVFAAATQGWMITRNRVAETALLLLVAFTLFVPGYWMDRLHPPLETVEVTQLQQVAEETSPGGHLRLTVEGVDRDGRDVSRTVMLPMGAAGSGQERLTRAGLGIMVLGDRVSVSFVTFGSPAERVGIESGWQVTEVLVPADRPAPEWFYLPALAVLAIVVVLQRRRVSAS